jgi:hypothetical protein
MQTRYVAHGLELRSRFQLAGMTPDETTAGLPVLALELATPAQVTDAWSGGSGPPAWRGRLGDGRSLRLERGKAGDLLFAYGDRARFHLDPSACQLKCAPRHTTLDWQRALIGKVLPSVSVMRGYEALHAGVVDSQDGVIAIVGPSGCGKSTLALELMRRGCLLFADDELTLQRNDRAVRAYPGTAHMTLPDGREPDAWGTVLDTLGDESWIAVGRRSERIRPVRMICLLERRASLRLGGQVLAANPLLLARHMLGLSTSPRRERRRFALYADLVEEATLLRLTGGLDSSPADLADVVERALGCELGLAVGVAR